jgi:integrase/recombinase XerD
VDNRNAKTRGTLFFYSTEPAWPEQYKKLKIHETIIIENPRIRSSGSFFPEWLELIGYSATTVYNLPNHLREFLHWLENQRREGGLSQNHLNKYIQALKLFSKYIRSTGQGSFTLDMMMIRSESPYLDGNKDILTVQEIQGLYRACDYTPYTPLALRDKAMLSVFYGCGLRRNEGVMLDTEDILFDKKLLYVRKGKHYRERYVPMNEKTIGDLANYLYDGRPYIVRGKNNCSFFVSDRLGARMQGQSLMARLKKLQKFNDNLQNKDFGLHTLRHSIATHLLQAGMKLQDIATFLGHKTLDSTQIYTHIMYGYVER